MLSEMRGQRPAASGDERLRLQVPPSQSTVLLVKEPSHMQTRHSSAARVVPLLTVLTVSDPTRQRSHRDVTIAAIRGGAGSVQLRAPELSDRDLLPLAMELSSLCRDAGVLFVVNDRIEVAIASGADGVHLGARDRPEGARHLLPSSMVLGITVEAPDEVARAEGLGASYIGVTVWTTSTKPEARPMGIDGLCEVAGSTAIPVIGIGGINAKNARSVLEAGAQGVAVISAVSHAVDMVSATRSLVTSVLRPQIGSTSPRAADCRTGPASG